MEIDATGSFKNYREAVQKAQKPLVPFMLVSPPPPLLLLFVLFRELPKTNYLPNSLLVASPSRTCSS